MAFSATGASSGASLGEGLGGALGGLIGFSLGAEDRRKEEELYQRMFQEWSSLDPRIRAKVEEALQLGPSEMENVSTDPAVRSRQLQALDSLMETGLSGGMDAQSRAALAQAQAQSAQQERGARLALQQQAQARGQGNSLTSYATQLAAQQGAAQRLGAESVQAAGDAQQRALASLAQGGTLAGDVRGQDFQEKSAKASARDAINAFNLRNRQDVEGRNIDRSLSAQQATIDNTFALGDRRNAAREQQAGYRRRRAQQTAGVGYDAGRGLGAGIGALTGGFGG